MSDQNRPAGTGLDPDLEQTRPIEPNPEKTPHEGPDLNDLEADNAVEEETIETVDPDNAPA